MKTITDNSYGEAGENFASLHFAGKSIPFKKATRTEDLTLGIDCYIGEEEHPTDIKNTDEIYVCQILVNTASVNTRHPFKAGSKATHYCVVEVDPKKVDKGMFKELTPIKERLIRDFIKDEKHLEEFYAKLQNIDGKAFKEFGHLTQACIRIKLSLLMHCKDGVTVSYPDVKELTEDISFKLIKRKTMVIKTPATKESLQAVLNKLKVQKEIKPQVNVFKENIITIKV